ncbi:MAG: hypothetical protein FWF81_02955 [Defluviitaleaceae bacterium]|nr:hypothetical protein [Defluviitaleaceae bacterium]
MATYETKVILRAVAEIVRSNKTRKAIYESVARIANAEGVVLPPVEEFLDDEEE